jgi:hypothetical protein
MRKKKGLAAMSVEQLIEVGQEEWRNITMKEVQERIADMPERCEILRNNGGKRIKGRKW